MPGTLQWEVGNSGASELQRAWPRPTMQGFVGHGRHCPPYSKNNEKSLTTFIREVLVLKSLFWKQYGE